MSAPKEIRRFNQIVELWEQPCVTGFEVWIRTLLPALIPCLISFVTPGGVEVIEIWLGRYHGVGGRALRKGAKLVFPNLVDTSKKVFMWKILAPFERTLFWWMVIDLVEDFFFTWESMALKASGCDPDNQWCTAAESGAVANDVGYQPCFLSVTEGNPHLCTVDGMLIPAGYAGGIGFGARSKEIAGVQGSMQMRLVDGWTGDTVFESGIITPDDARDGINFAWFQRDHAVSRGRWLKPQAQAFGLPCGIEVYGSVGCSPLPA